MDNNKINCSFCGKSFSLNSKFCEFCGKKLEKAEDNEVIKQNLEFSKFDDQIKNKKIKKSRVPIVIIAVIITFIICALLTFLFFNFYFKNQTQTTIKKDVTVTDTGIADSVEKIMDAVVVVESYQNNKLYTTGTGFVFKTSDDKGYILTNNHVISSATDVYVVFTNNNREKVEIVGKDTYSDIAVLGVEKSKILAIAETGSSNELRVGDTTFAVGAPLDSEAYSWTVTRGILSGKNRIVEVNSGNTSLVMSVLQTDTAINSGNSGGPLCNANGEVIGITNMKITNSSVEGMGFAIPIETAISYANKFLNKEAIVRPYLGISMSDISNNIFSTSTGVYISAVEENSPAFNAGIKAGDIVTAIDDKKVSNTSYLKYELYKHNVGDKITLTITRNTKEIKVNVTLGSTSTTT